MSDEMEEFWQLFRDESEDALNNSEDCLVALENDRGNKDQINTLFRAIHTFKGSSRMMGLTGIESIAHVFEDTVGLIRDKDVELDDTIYNLLLKTIDTLRELLEKVLDTRENYPIDDYKDLYESLKVTYSKYSGGDVSAAPLDTENTIEEEGKIQEPLEEIDATTDELDEMNALPLPGDADESNSDNGGKFDPSKDPKFVKVFLEIVENEMSQLDTLSDKLNALDDKLINDIKKVLDNLMHASENMHYKEIVYAIERLHAELNHSDNPEFTDKWLKLEAKLRDELDKLHKNNDKAEAKALKEDATSSEKGEIKTKQHDPQTDPQYVKIFFDLADSELINLRRELDLLSQGQGKQENLFKVIDRIQHAAENMHYTRIVSKLNDIHALIEGKSASEINYDEIGSAEISLREEIRAIFNVVDVKGSDALKDEAMHSNEASSVFVQTYAKQAQFNIDRLEKDVQKIIDNFKKIKSGEAREFDKESIVSIIKVLKNIYHTSVFYSLHTTSQMTLVLEDLYSRVFQSEITLSDKIIETTDSFCKQANQLFQKVENKEKADETFIIELLKQIRSEVFVSSDNQLSRITTKVLDMLNIDPAFRDLLTAENLVDISEHLHNGSSFYTMLADLESNEEAAMQFYEMTQRENIQAISNITVYEGDRTLFRFLMASTLEEEQINEMLANIDPDQTYFKLAPCMFMEPNSELADSDDSIGPIDNFFDDFSLDEDFEIQSESTSYHAESLEDMEINDSDLVDSVGQLVIAHSALTHLVDEINQNDISSQFGELFKGKDYKGSKDVDLKKILDITEVWSEDLKNKLGQIMRDFASSLDFLKDLSVQLRNVPSKLLTDPLNQLIRDTSHHFDKRIEFDVFCDQNTIDKDIVDKTLPALKDLVWYIIVHSIENSKDRQIAGKQSYGTIKFRFENLDDRIQMTISEDGTGFSKENMISLAKKYNININDFETCYDILLDEKVGEYNSGHAEQKGISFSDIKKDLSAKNGTLHIKESSLGGSEYIITMPLSAIVIDGMVVRVGQINYIVPIKSIRRILKAEDKMINHFSTDGGENYIKLGDDVITIKSLTRGRSAHHNINPDDVVYVVIESNEKVCAFDIDELIGQQQVLVHPLQGFLSDVPSMSGCAVLAGGTIGMVLDVNEITKLKKNNVRAS